MINYNISDKDKKKLQESSVSALNEIISNPKMITSDRKSTFFIILTQYLRTLDIGIDCVNNDYELSVYNKDKLYQWCGSSSLANFICDLVYVRNKLCIEFSSDGMMSIVKKMWVSNELRDILDKIGVTTSCMYDVTFRSAASLMSGD